MVGRFAWWSVCCGGMVGVGCVGALTSGWSEGVLWGVVKCVYSGDVGC